MEQILPLAVTNLYDLIGEVGGGSSGKVFHLRNKETNDNVAAKMIEIDPPLITSPTTERRFNKALPLAKQSNQSVLEKKLPSVLRRELKYTKSLNNPNLIKFVDSYIAHNQLIIITELCQFDLGYLLNNNLTTQTSISIKSIQNIFHQLVDAIHFLHSRNLVHRDVKPDNMFFWVDPKLYPSLNKQDLIDCINQGDQKINYRLKIGDYGFTREVSKSLASDGGRQVMSHNVATSWYRAPEILEQRPYGLLVDVWALGCTLVECLLGVPLFAHDEPLKSIKEFSFRSTDNTKSVWKKLTLLVSRSCIDVVEKCLEFDESKRIDTEGLLKTAFYMRRRIGWNGKKKNTNHSNVQTNMLSLVFRNFSDFSYDLYNRLVSVGRIFSNPVAVGTTKVRRKRYIEDANKIQSKKIQLESVKAEPLDNDPVLINKKSVKAKQPSRQSFL